MFYYSSSSYRHRQGYASPQLTSCLLETWRRPEAHESRPKSSSSHGALVHTATLEHCPSCTAGNDRSHQVGASDNPKDGRTDIVNCIFCDLLIQTDDELYSPNDRHASPAGHQILLLLRRQSTCYVKPKSGKRRWSAHQPTPNHCVIALPSSIVLPPLQTAVVASKRIE